MDRTLERVWDEYIVPVFIERFLMVVCAAAFYGLVITNNMNFNSLQRIGLAFALVGLALFLGATAYKQTHPASSAPSVPPAPSVNQNATDSSCSNVNAGRDAAVNCSPSTENKDAPK